MSERMLTVFEVRVYLHAHGITSTMVARQTVAKWLRADLFPGAKKGAGPTSPWRIPKASVEAFKPPTMGGRMGRPRKAQKGQTE